MFKENDTVYLKKERFISAVVISTDYNRAGSPQVQVEYQKPNGAIGIVTKWVNVEDISKRKGE